MHYFCKFDVQKILLSTGIKNFILSSKMNKLREFGLTLLKYSGRRVFFPTGELEIG